MEFNPLGLLLFFFFIVAALLVCAFVVSELLLLIGFLKSQRPKPRILLTAILFIIFSATLYFYKCSGNFSDTEPVKVESAHP